MKKVLKTVITVIAMSALLLSLAACGGKEETPNNTQVPNQENQQTNQQPESGSKDLIASIAEVPGLANSSEDGLFIEILKAMDEVYTEGNIKIELYPFPRSLENAITGKADFHWPMSKNTFEDPASRDFDFSTASIGEGDYVLYTNVNKKISWKEIQDAATKGGEFPYVIEVMGNSDKIYGFRNELSPSPEQSLLKVNSGKIDAYIGVQEESDDIVKAQKLKNLFRENCFKQGDCFAIQRSEKGKEVDAILTTIIDRLNSTGKLQELYSKMHLPYQEWQPSEMGW